MNNMVSCTEKIVLNGQPANFLNKVNNNKTVNAEEEKLNKTITDFSDSEEINISREFIDVSKINKNRQKDNKIELLVFDEETKMQIDNNYRLSNNNNILNENNLMKNKHKKANFEVIKNNFHINNIDNRKPSGFEKSSSKILQKSLNRYIKKDNDFKGEKNSKNIYKNKPFVCIGSQDVTANLTDSNSNNLSSERFNIFQTHNFNKLNQHSFLNDNISEKINLKEDNFSSFTEKKETLLEQEEIEILQNFVPEIKKEKKSIFNLEFIPSDESSNLDNFNSGTNGTINSHLDENDDEENSYNTEKAKDSTRKKRFNSDYKSGRWTNEEHVSFLEAIFLYNNNWRKVQQHIKTRSSTQARSHAQKFFISLKKKIMENTENPSEKTFNQEKLKKYLREAVEDLFFKKIYARSIMVRDEIFYERRDKLVSLIIALLSSNTKNKNSFFKCIDSKELVKPRNNSVKKLNIKKITDAFIDNNANKEENNLENSLNIKPCFSLTSPSEAKLNNNDITNITRNNSNINMNFSIDQSSIKNNNLNSEFTSMNNSNSNLNKIMWKYSDNNLFMRNFNDKKIEDYDNNLNKYSNISVNYFDIAPESNNFNVNFSSQNIVNNFASKIILPYERKNINLNLDDKKHMNQTLQLSQTYVKKEISNNLINNFSNQNKNNAHNTNFIYKTEMKISNNDIVEDLAKNYYQNNYPKKADLIDSCDIIDLKIKKNNINNAIVNLGSHSFSSKDIDQNLCWKKFDSMLSYNSENFNKIRRSSIISVNSKFKNDKLLAKNQLIDDDLSIQNLFKIDSNEKKYISTIKELDLKENSLSDFAQDSLSEPDIIKNTNEYSSHKTKLGNGKTKSFIKNKYFNKYNDNYNLELETEKNQKDNNVLVNKAQDDHNKNLQFVNDPVSSKNFKKLLNNIRQQSNTNNLQINYNVFENCNNNTNQNFPTNYESLNNIDYRADSTHIFYNYDNLKNDLINQNRIETRDDNSIINNSYPKAYSVDFKSESQKKIIMNKLSNNFLNENSYNENNINKFDKSILNERKVFKISENQNTLNNNLHKFNENAQNNIPNKKAFEMCDSDQIQKTINNSNAKNYLNKMMIQNEYQKNLIFINSNNQNKNDLSENNVMLLNSNYQNKIDIGKKKFKSSNIDLFQDLSENVKKCGELKNIEDNTPLTHPLSFYSHQNQSNINSTNILDKSRFLKTFNNKIKYNVKESYQDNHNKSFYFNDKATSHATEIPIADKIYQNIVKLYNNEDISDNKILKNIEIFNNCPSKNFQDYLNNFEKQPINEREANNNNISMNLSTNKDFESKLHKSNLHNPSLFNNSFNQKNPSLDKIVNENNTKTNANHFVNDSQNKQNTYTNLNNNNYINIVNINVLPSKEPNITQKYSTDIYENGEDNINNNFKKETSTNEKITVEKKIQNTLLNQQINDVLNTNLKNSDISSATINTFKVPNKTNSLNNLTNNNNTKSIFDDDIVTNIYNNNSIKEINSNPHPNTDFFNNSKSSKQFTNSNNYEPSSEELIKNNNNSNFANNQTSSKAYIDGNDLISNLNNTSHVNTKGLHKESKEDTLNPFNLNFNVEEEKGFIGNNKDIIFASYMNNPKEEDEFLGFYLLPN